GPPSPQSVPVRWLAGGGRDGIFGIERRRGTRLDLPDEHRRANATALRVRLYRETLFPSDTAVALSPSPCPLSWRAGFDGSGFRARDCAGVWSEWEASGSRSLAEAVRGVVLCRARGGGFEPGADDSGTDAGQAGVRPGAAAPNQREKRSPD